MRLPPDVFVPLPSTGGILDKEYAEGLLELLRVRKDSSMYQDNDRKFVAVLNRTIPLPKLLNALAHCSAGGAAIFGEAMLELQPYVDASSEHHLGISRFPWIVLQSKNSSQLHALKAQALTAGLLVTDFVHTMIGNSAADQLQSTKTTKGVDLLYYAVCLFGPAATINPLTKKYSVFTNVVSPNLDDK